MQETTTQQRVKLTGYIGQGNFTAIERKVKANTHGRVTLKDYASQALMLQLDNLAGIGGHASVLHNLGITTIKSLATSKLFSDAIRHTSHMPPNTSKDGPDADYPKLLEGLGLLDLTALTHYQPYQHAVQILAASTTGTIH